MIEICLRIAESVTLSSESDRSNGYNDSAYIMNNEIKDLIKKANRFLKSAGVLLDDGDWGKRI